MSVGISIRTNTDGAKKKLLVIRRKLGTEALDDVGKLVGLSVMEWIDRNFRSGGRTGGGSWKSLRPATIRAKGSSAILQDKGFLKRSFQKSPNPKVRSTLRALTVEVGTNIKYASLHEFGTRRLPKRPMLPKAKIAEGLAIKTLKAYVDQVVRLANVGRI